MSLSAVGLALRQHLHLDELDQRATPCEHPVALKQGLFLERLELQVLPQCVHEVVVGHVARQTAAVLAVQRRTEDGLEAVPRGAQVVAIGVAKGIIEGRVDVQIERAPEALDHDDGPLRASPSRRV